MPTFRPSDVQGAERRGREGGREGVGREVKDGGGGVGEELIRVATSVVPFYSGIVEQNFVSWLLDVPAIC